MMCILQVFHCLTRHRSTLFNPDLKDIVSSTWYTVSDTYMTDTTEILRRAKPKMQVPRRIMQRPLQQKETKSALWHPDSVQES